MKTATRGHGTIVKRMERAGLPYEITDVSQIPNFILTSGGTWVVVAQWDYVPSSRVFVGFYGSRQAARAARDAARRLQCVTSTRVIRIPTEEEMDQA